MNSCTENKLIQYCDPVIFCDWTALDSGQHSTDSLANIITIPVEPLHHHQQRKEVACASCSNPRPSFIAIHELNSHTLILDRVWRGEAVAEEFNYNLRTSNSCKLNCNSRCIFRHLCNLFGWSIIHIYSALLLCTLYGIFATAFRLKFRIFPVLLSVRGTSSRDIVRENCRIESQQTDGHSSCFEGSMWTE